MTDTQLLDQQGMSFITHLLSHKKCIVNEYKRDSGLDAICEVREAPYQSSGLIWAIQLKSGKSYFSNESEDYYYFYADQKHINYWLKCCLPVLFIMYHPSLNKAFWVNINKNNLTMTKKGCKISIPKVNDLEQLQQDDLLSLFYGKLYRSSNDFHKILDDLKRTTHIEKTKIKISCFELFINGLCDMCRQLYFFTDLYSNIMEYKLTPTDIDSFGYSNRLFDDYFYILNYHNLLLGSFEKEKDDINNELTPFFVKHLSKNGLLFLSFLRDSGFKIHDRIFVRQWPEITYIYLDD